MSAILVLIPRWLKKTVAAVLAAFLCLAAGYLAGAINERQRSALAGAEATAKAIQKRVDIDEEVINMDARRPCLKPDTALYLVGNDLRAGQDIASHNQFSIARGCWK